MVDLGNERKSDVQNRHVSPLYTVVDAKIAPSPLSVSCE